MTTQHLRCWARWGLVTALGLAAWLSLRPGSAAQWFSGQDKVLHMAAHGVFYVLGALAWSPPTWRLPALLFGYGLCIEALQALVPGRVTSVGDLFANGAGLALGALATGGLRPRRAVEPRQ